MKEYININNSLTFIILATLAPISFFFSNNHSQYTLLSIFLTMCVGIFIGIITWIISLSINLVLSKLIDKPWMKIFIHALAATCISIILTHISWSIYFGWICATVICFVLAATAFIVIYFFDWKTINVFLIVFVLVSSGRLAVTSYDLEKATPDFSSPTAMPTTFVLKNRPNIYFFFLESFHDREAINRLYGFDAPDFYSQLYKNNFTLYDAFATNLGTVQALLPLVTMRHHYSRITFGHSELSRKGRIFLTDNNVFRILKNNNYSINLFDNNNHVFRYDSPLVNYANFKRYTNSRLQYIIDAFVTMNKNLDALIPVLSLVFNKNFSHLDDIVLHSVSSVPDDFLNYYPSKFNIKQPGFYFIHFGAIHIPWEIGFYEATEYKKTFDEKYRNQYVQGTIDTLRILEYIIKNDPQSLIILMGDHGAFGNGLYREISKMNVTEANKFFRNHKIEPKDAARHLISVLLAVRWPNKYAPNYQPRDGFGDVNLFPFIFSVLSNIPYNDDNFSPNFSMCTPRGFIMAKYGNLLDDWEDFNENPDNPNKIYMHDK